MLHEEQIKEDASSTAFCCVESATNRPYAKRKQWTNTQMEVAIKAVLNSTRDSINSAAREHGVPTTTLKNRLSGRVVHGTNSGPVPYLSKVEEDELVDYLSEANKVGYGKTRRQVSHCRESGNRERCSS